MPGAFEDLSRHEGVAAIPGVLIVRPDAPLFFANAQSVQDQVEALVAGRKAEVRALILDLDANDEIDITSAERLGRLVSELQKHNVQVGLAKLHAPAAAMARRSGLFDELPETQVFPTVRSAVAWAQRDRGGP